MDGAQASPERLVSEIYRNPCDQKDIGLIPSASFAASFALHHCTQAQKEVSGVRAAAGERVQCAFDSVVNGCSHGPLASEGVLDMV